MRKLQGTHEETCSFTFLNIQPYSTVSHLMLASFENLFASCSTWIDVIFLVFNHFWRLMHTKCLTFNGKNGQFEKKLVFFNCYFTYFNFLILLYFILMVKTDRWSFRCDTWKEPALYLLVHWQHKPAMLTLIECFLVKKKKKISWRLTIFNIISPKQQSKNKAIMI